jgi:hypothetical protein
MSSDTQADEVHLKERVETGGMMHEYRSTVIRPWMRVALAWTRALHVLFTLLFGGALGAGFGCAATEEPEAASALRQRFPDQAARVLENSEAFVAREQGFSTDETGDVEAALLRRGGLSIALPASAEGMVRLHLAGGFEVRARELGASGQGVLTGHAVAYARDGGTSFWSATPEGYEEWLLLDADRVKRGAPVAAWEIDGAVLRQEGEAVAVADATGVTRLALLSQHDGSNNRYC